MENFRLLGRSARTRQGAENLVRFFCDAEGCTNPVVYIEYNGNASWPTEFWEWPRGAEPRR
jgi:hypothetical protein